MIRLEYDNRTQAGDLAQDDDGRMIDDDGLETSVLICLFTDRRADPGDGAEEGDMRGWWGDAYPNVQGDKIGSKLWLLFRQKLVSDSRQKAVRYAEEALAWMIEDGVASRVPVSADWIQEGSLKIGVALTVQIQKPGEIAPKWKRTWELYSAV